MAPILMLVALALHAASVAPQPAEWRLVTIVVPQKGTGCINDPSAQAGYVWIRRDANEQSNRDALTRRLKAEQPTAYSSGYVMSARRPRVFGLIRKDIACLTWKGPRKSVVSYEFLEGKDLDDLTAKMEKRKATHPEEIKGFSIELIGGAAELEKLAVQGESTVIGRPVR